jgi:hypothetical protein
MVVSFRFPNGTTEQIDNPDGLELRRKPRRRRYLFLQKDPVFQPIIYHCQHQGCHKRLLLGVRNPGHVRHAIPTIQALGWGFHPRTQGFFCNDHKYIPTLPDVRRSLPSYEARRETPSSSWVYHQPWYRNLVFSHPRTSHPETHRTTRPENP